MDNKTNLITIGEFCDMTGVSRTTAHKMFKQLSPVCTNQSNGLMYNISEVENVFGDKLDNYIRAHAEGYVTLKKFCEMNNLKVRTIKGYMKTIESCPYINHPEYNMYKYDDIQQCLLNSDKNTNDHYMYQLIPEPKNEYFNATELKVILGIKNINTVYNLLTRASVKPTIVNYNNRKYKYYHISDIIDLMRSSYYSQTMKREGVGTVVAMTIDEIKTLRRDPMTNKLYVDDEDNCVYDEAISKYEAADVINGSVHDVMKLIGDGKIKVFYDNTVDGSKIFMGVSKKDVIKFATEEMSVDTHSTIESFEKHDNNDVSDKTEHVDFIDENNTEYHEVDHLDINKSYNEAIKICDKLLIINRLIDKNKTVEKLVSVVSTVIKENSFNSFEVIVTMHDLVTRLYKYKDYHSMTMTKMLSFLVEKYDGLLVNGV